MKTALAVGLMLIFKHFCKKLCVSCQASLKCRLQAGFKDDSVNTIHTKHTKTEMPYANI